MLYLSAEGMPIPTIGGLEEAAGFEAEPFKKQYAASRYRSMQQIKVYWDLDETVPHIAVSAEVIFRYWREWGQYLWRFDGWATDDQPYR